jgi:hypothetical protein
VDRNLEIANKYNVVNNPSMIILKEGEKQEEYICFLQNKAIEKIL